MEGRWKVTNKIFGKLNIRLKGKLTDLNEFLRAISAIRSLLPSVEFFINSSNRTSSGLSPFELDRGRNLRTVSDTPDILRELEKRMKNCKVKGALEFFENLQKTIKLLRDQHNILHLKHVWRYKFKHDFGSIKNNNRKNKKRTQ